MNSQEPRRLRRVVLRASTLASVLLAPAIAFAQTNAPATSVAPAAPAAAPTAALIPTAPNDAADAFAKQQKQIDELLAHTKAQDAQITSLQETAASSTDDSASAPTRLLSFWGFSDLTFGGMKYDNPNALYKIQTPYNATFFSSGINLYAKSEMTRTLSALVEAQLTYSPNGFVSNWPQKVMVGNTTIATQGSNNRISTTVQEPFSQLNYNLSGIFIQRSYMEWKPKDWFGVRVGKFLTPFGIWNEDHGSPVLIGIGYPQFMSYNIIPIQQLGVEAFGTIPITDDFHAEYALTVANSDGPNPDYKDLTDMKALGARLKLVYNHDDFTFRLGGYAYYSQYMDSTESITVHLTPKLTLDNSYNPAFGSATTVNESYDETLITGDAEMRWKKLRVLGEYAHQTIIYTSPETIGAAESLLKAPLNVTLYDPSHYGFGGYVMAAYEIPIHGAIEMSVTPYAGFDFVTPSTSETVRSNHQYRAGINVKPSPYVTLKFEAARWISNTAAVGSNADSFMSQVAYSF
jgi:hypothetical protein